MSGSQAPSAPPGNFSWLDRSGAAPVLAGLATVALSWWVWSFSADPPAQVQDENAYRLQAGIFAAGRWADPPPPAASFFDQIHVLSRPVRAAKYPPGQALALAPGFLARAPVAVPLLLDFALGALVFALARRASGGAVGLLAWILWLAAPVGLVIRSSYFSELTTGTLWLIGWWALWNWSENPRPGWLLLFGLAVGWGAITRPLTAIAFALPAGICALRLALRRRAWGALAAATLLGAATLAIWPMWSLETTGDARLTPLALYTRDVLPWDRPGFGLRDGEPRRELAPDVRGTFVEGFRRLHSEHTVANLPRILAARLVAIARDAWGVSWGVLCAFAVFGCVMAPSAPRMAFASAGLLVLLYLCYAHYPNWTVYYFEMSGVLAYATGLGLWKGYCLLASRSRSARPALAVAGPWLLAAVVAVAVAPRLIMIREEHEAALREVRAFATALHGLPPGPAVVFVRYGPNHDPHRSLIVNGPGLDGARVWIVYDRGRENPGLLRLSPHRAPFEYDEATRTLSALDGAAPVPVGAP